MFYIYVILNTINNKRYVGKCNNIRLRLANHKSIAFNSNSPNYIYPFYKSIRKYAQTPDNFDNIFKIELLEEFETEQGAFEKEIFYIDHYKTNITKYGLESNGYNLSNGGEGSKGIKWSLEARKRFSQKTKGRRLSESTKNKLRISSSGRKQSLESRKKISISKIGDKNPQFGKTLSDETKEKISKALSGIKRGPQSEERRKAASIFRKGKPGTSHTEEYKKKMSEARNGEGSSWATKLTWEMVNKIRSEYIPGEHGYVVLSKIYNVAVSTIAHIIKNRTWKQ